MGQHVLSWSISLLLIVKICALRIIFIVKSEIRTISHFLWLGHETTWWRHQMETVSALLAICAGNSPAPVNSPHKGQGRGALMLSLIYAWINDWVNNREAGDLRRHRGHYVVIVMNGMCCCMSCYVLLKISGFPKLIWKFIINHMWSQRTKMWHNEHICI